MRRVILLTILSICATTVFARNEEVVAISYNPSRLGVYNSLTAVSKATLRGGVHVTRDGTMNISSAADRTVSFEDDQLAHRCTAGNCTQLNINTITNISPRGSNLQTSAFMTGTATIQKHNSGSPYLGNRTISDYQTSSPTGVQGTTVQIRGGRLDAKGDSFIDNFKNDDAEKVTVQNLSINVRTLLTIGRTGETNRHFAVKDSFQLGSIVISGTGAQGCTDSCIGYEWVTRFPEEIDGRPNDAGVRVLAVRVKN